MSRRLTQNYIMHDVLHLLNWSKFGCGNWRYRRQIVPKFRHVIRGDCQVHDLHLIFAVQMKELQEASEQGAYKEALKYLVIDNIMNLIADASESKT